MQISSISPLSAKPRTERPNATVGDLPTTGRDVGIAVIDSGVHPHPDLDDRLVASVTFYQEGRPDRDELGHGTATAGVIGANGKSSNGRIQGVAPGAKLINLKVLTAENASDPVQGYASMLSALDWAVQNRDEFNIRVINISGGFSPIAQKDANGQISAFLDPFGTAIEKAVEAGIVVVAAAGNDGPTPDSIVRTPNHNPSVITVGALDSQGTPDDPSDDRVAPFSSRGAAWSGDAKPDLVASGVGLLTTLAPYSEMSATNDAKAARLSNYLSLDGPELLHQLRTDLETQRLSGPIFTPAADAVIAALPSTVAEKLSGKNPGQAGRLAVRMACELHARGALPTEGEAFQAAIEAMKAALADGLSPRPTEGYLEDGRPAYIALDGTSFAAPIVSGVVAHMFEANPDLTPAQVKSILKDTAVPIADRDPSAVGAGALNAQAAVARAAEQRRAVPST